MRSCAATPVGGATGVLASEGVCDEMVCEQVPNFAPAVPDRAITCMGTLPIWCTHAHTPTYTLTTLQVHHTHTHPYPHACTHRSRCGRATCVGRARTPTSPSSSSALRPAPRRSCWSPRPTTLSATRCREEVHDGGPGAGRQLMSAMRGMAGA